MIWMDGFVIGLHNNNKKMIRHIKTLDYYAVDFAKNTYHFWTEAQAVRALRKYIKSMTK
jgi:hypothetical protein